MTQNSDNPEALALRLRSHIDALDRMSREHSHAVLRVVLQYLADYIKKQDDRQMRSVLIASMLAVLVDACWEREIDVIVRRAAEAEKGIR